MTPENRKTQPLFSISRVEHETGISRILLRMWERRYGFPRPLRDPHGDRAYPQDQVERLRLIRRLMDAGFRPGKLVPESLAHLQRLLPAAAAEKPSPRMLAALQSRDPVVLKEFLQHELISQGLERLVCETLPRMVGLVGELWSAGTLSVFEEHLFTEQVRALLRPAIAALQTPLDGPKVLLATLSGEKHGLGLLLSTAYLKLKGANVLSFGTEMPVSEVVAAARAHNVAAVGLSFAAGYPLRPLRQALADLRAHLPEKVALWAGGEGVRQLKPQMRKNMPTVKLIHRMEDAAPLLAELRRK